MRKTKPSTSRTLFQLVIFILGALYIFAPISGWLKSESTFVLMAEEEGTHEELAVAPALPSPSPTASPEPADPDMEAIVRQVFGEHTDTAMRLLSCENRSLDPEAINQNYDTNHTVDYGLFQINSYWQGIRHEGKAKQFLMDPEINARIAYRLYVDSGYSFKLWTCGKEMGI